VGLGEGPPEHGEVLAEDVDEPAMNGAVPRHHAITEELLVFQPEACGPVGDEPVELYEGVGIEQEVEALPGRELSALVLGGHPPFSPALLALESEGSELLELLVHRHRARMRGGKSSRVAEAPGVT